MTDNLLIGGGFRWEIETRSGNVRDRGFAKNGVTDKALDSILNTYFRSGTPVAHFYAGLIKGDSTYLGVNATDLIDSHPGWAEGQAYSESTRPLWSPGASTARLLTNGTKMVFTCNAVQTYSGFFIASDNVKGDTAGLLWCTALFSVLKEMATGEKLKCYYDLSAAAF